MHEVRRRGHQTGGRRVSARTDDRLPDMGGGSAQLSILAQAGSL